MQIDLKKVWTKLKISARARCLVTIWSSHVIKKTNGTRHVRGPKIALIINMSKASLRTQL